ncbi:hypothetical protein Tco_0379230 [Tanacetum coccineum]
MEYLSYQSDIVSAASAATTVSAATTTTATITTVDDINLAQALKEMKSTKPKKKGVIIQELGNSTTTISSQQSQGKGKEILIEPVKPMNKKDQIRRQGHLNFKTMNKLVKGNLVRGLPSKLLENDQIEYLIIQRCEKLV